MIARFVAWWRERTERERVVLSLGLTAVLVMGVYGIVIDPWIERSERLERRIANRQDDLERVMKLVAQHRAESSRVAELIQGVAEASGFALLSFLEETASTLQIREKLSSIRPQPTQTVPPFRELSAEVKLQGITLGQVVSYLEAFGRAPQRVRVKTLRLKTRFADPELLDGSFVVSTYERMS